MATDIERKATQLARMMVAAQRAGQKFVNPWENEFLHDSDYAQVSELAAIKAREMLEGKP